MGGAGGAADPVGIMHHDHIAGLLAIETIAHALVDAVTRAGGALQFRAGVDPCHMRLPAQRLGRHPFHIGTADGLSRHWVTLQIDAHLARAFDVVAGTKGGNERCLHRVTLSGDVITPARQLPGNVVFRRHGDAVIRRQHHQHLPPAGLCFRRRQQLPDSAVHRQNHVVHLWRLGAGGMAEIVGRGETHRQQIGLLVSAQVLFLDHLQGKFQHQFVGEGRGVQAGKEALARLHRQLPTQPVSAQIALGGPGRVVRLHPRRQRRKVPGAGQDGAGIAEPERTVRIAPGGQDGAAILQRDAVDLAALAGQLQLITDGRNQQAVGRSARHIASVLSATQGRRIVIRNALDCSAFHTSVPGIAGNAADRRHRTGQEGGMPHGRDRRRRLVVGIGKHGALLQQALEPAGELVLEAGQIVIAHLVDDDGEHQRGARGRFRGRLVTQWRMRHWLNAAGHCGTQQDHSNTVGSSDHEQAPHFTDLTNRPRRALWRACR